MVVRSDRAAWTMAKLNTSIPAGPTRAEIIVVARKKCRVHTACARLWSWGGGGAPSARKCEPGSGLLQGGRNGGELRDEGRGHEGDRADDHDRNQTGDQAKMDRSAAGL